MFWNKKPSLEDVVDAVSGLFTKEELEEMGGLESPYHEDFRQILLSWCRDKKPRFSVNESTNILLASKIILYSRYDGKNPGFMFWVSYCYDNLFE